MQIVFGLAHKPISVAEPSPSNPPDITWSASRLKEYLSDARTISNNLARLLLPGLIGNKGFVGWYLPMELATSSVADIIQENIRGLKEYRTFGEHTYPIISGSARYVRVSSMMSRMVLAGFATSCSMVRAVMRATPLVLRRL